MDSSVLKGFAALRVNGKVRSGKSAHINNNAFFLKLNANNEFRQFLLLGPAILSFGKLFCNSAPKRFVFLLAHWHVHMSQMDMIIDLHQIASNFIDEQCIFNEIHSKSNCKIAAPALHA